MTTDITIKSSSANINRLIKAVKTTGDKYNHTVQDTIVAIIRHAKDYSDCTGAARLLEALPQSNRRQLVVDHFGQYSPINVVKKGDAFHASLRKPFFDKDETKPNKMYNDYNIDGVKVNNWWERAGAEKLPDVINYDSIRTRTLAFFESQLKKADKIENDNDKAEAVAFLKVIRSSASAYNVEAVAKNAIKGTEWDEGEADEQAMQLVVNG